MSNDDILKKVDEIIAYIKNSKDYQNYLILKNNMQDDKAINECLDEIRRLQKTLANNPSLKDELEPLLNEKNNQLSDNPLYREYLNSIEEINNVFNIIENELNKYFYDKLN